MNYGNCISLLLDCIMFFLRMILTLTGFYAVLMATVFNRQVFYHHKFFFAITMPPCFRRERHALSATKATLQLLKTDSYGAI